MDSAEIKRMILAESEHTGIRKKMMENRNKEGGLNDDDIIEMGTSFDSMVKTKGWAYIEAYIINRANPVALVFEDGDNQMKKGMARALMGLMQYVKQIIDAKDELLARINKERGTEAVKD